MHSEKQGAGIVAPVVLTSMNDSPAFSTIEIPPVAAYDLLRSGDGVIVDVRLMEEMEFFGEVEGAISLPLGVIQSIAGAEVDPAYVQEIANLFGENKARLLAMLVQHAFRNTTLLCLCRSGNRSLTATRILRACGYHHAYSIAGGIVAWEESGLPLIQAED